MAELALKLRHYRFDFVEGQPWCEASMSEVEATYALRPGETALVLVDC